MWIAILAAVCMVFQDVLGVCMVQAEARNRGWIAGLCDAAQWIFTISTTSISVTALQGHNTTEKVLVVAFVTAANLFGSQLGVLIGKRLIKEDLATNPVIERVAEN